MVRILHIGILFFAMFFTFLFLTGNPIRETYVSAPPAPKETAPTDPKTERSDTDKKQEKTTIAEDTARATDAVSKIAETVAGLRQKIADVVSMSSVPLPSQSPEETNAAARAALVNIYCATQSAGTTRLSTGSGVMINPRGIILTNAHVAQHFLFENAPAFGNTDCIIRAGSPASPFYDAEILYISPSWIKENAAAFREENPRGTGENDFALLYVTRSLRKDTSLPEQFPYLTPETDAETIRKGDSVLLASYPAGFLGSIAIQKDLYQTSTIAQIKELFTFKENSVDMFSVGGNVVAQKGSSGSGAVSLTTGKILGIVVTSGESETTDGRNLQVIVFAHMSESMKKDVGFTLEEFLSGDPSAEAASFQKNVSPVLLQLLSAQ
ncbi:MAG: trypsin-like peptidase domain-containing protein [Patescibacteria group bacterium]